MGVGGGNLQTFGSTKPIPAPGPPGPPFLLTSANNGLSVDPISFKIVLGQSIGAVGDPAQLLDNREIPMNGFLFQLGTNADQRFLVNPAGNYYALGDINLTNQGTYIELNDNFSLVNIYSQIGNQMLTLQNLPPFVQFFAIGDLAGLATAIKLQLNLQEATISTFNGNMLYADDAALLYKLGDIDTFNNGTFLQINDATQVSQMGNVSGSNTGFRSWVDAANLNFQIFDTAGEYFFVDAMNGQYAIGDLSELANGTQINIDDTNKKVQISQPENLNPGLLIDFQSWHYQLGDILGLNDNSYIDVYDLPGMSNITLFAGSNSNGANIQLDDFFKKVDITNFTSDMIIRINGVAGFTGTVTPVTTITVNGGVVTNVA